MTLELGKMYKFTLVSGRVVEIVVHGTSPNGIDISVDGTRRTYGDLNGALGEPFTQVSPALSLLGTWASQPYALRAAEWLQWRVSQVENRDSELRPLKDKVNELSAKLKTASEREQAELLRQQNDAIAALIKHINSK